MAITPNTGDFGQRMIEALGLPEHTVEFELRCAVDEVVTVMCRYYPDPDTAGLESAFAEYTLERRQPAPHDEQQMHFDAWMDARNAVAHAALVRGYGELSRMDRWLR